MKVCSKEASLLQDTYKTKVFSTFEENIKVSEYKGYNLSRLDTLLQKIGDDLTKISKSQNIHSKLTGITFSHEIGYKIRQFTMEENLTLGVIHFGMVAISKENDTLEAISCLYTVNFEMKGRKRLETVVPQRNIENFFRYKVLNEFKKRNLVSNINDVSSLDCI